MTTNVVRLMKLHINEVAPEKIAKIKKENVFFEKWMTREVIPEKRKVQKLNN